MRGQVDGMQSTPAHGRSTRKRVCLLSAVAIAFALLAAPGTATAKPERKTFMVSPVKVEITAKPGETKRRTLQLVNQGDETMTVARSTMDYWIRPDNSFVFSKPAGKSYSAATWIQHDHPNTLEPGQIHECPLVVKVPEDAEPGDHYAAALFTAAGTDPAKTGTKIDGQIASVILVTVAGPTDSKADILDFDVRKAGLFSRDIDTDLLFSDRGNVHVNTLDHVVFKNMFGKPIGNISQGALTVLPNSERRMQTRWTAPFIGVFKAQATVNYGPNLYTFDKKLSSREVTFWVVSPEAIAVLLGCIAAAGVLFYLDVVRRRRHAGLDHVDDEGTYSH